MISQFFEVQIRDGLVSKYMGLAKDLRPLLESMGGCLFIERFKSLSRNNLILSYQIWQDEGSMIAWRVNEKHHAVQMIGREEVFADYRIRIAQVIYEKRPGAPAWEPARRTPYNDPSRRPPTYVLASESATSDLPSTPWHHDSFESMYRDAHFAHLIEIPDVGSGIQLGRELLNERTTEYFRIFEVYRDYGMYDRKEAPQFYPPVAGDQKA